MKQFVCSMIGWTFQQKQIQEGNQSPMQAISREGSCHRSYMFWRNGLNSLSFDSQLSKSGSVRRERKGGLLMHASISTVYFISYFLSVGGLGMATKVGLHEQSPTQSPRPTRQWRPNAQGRGNLGLYHFGFKFWLGVGNWGCHAPRVSHQLCWP